MSQDETPIEVTLGGVIDTLEHALTLSQESAPPGQPAPAEATPPAETSEDARLAAIEASAPLDVPSGQYWVTSEDRSWEDIAAKLGVDVDALYDANADQQLIIQAGRHGIPVGTLITVPGA